MSMIGNIELFNNNVRIGMTEVINQRIDMFNAASNGAIILQRVNFAKNVGDFSTEFYTPFLDLVRERDPYSSAEISQVSFGSIKRSSVKVSRGTYEVVHSLESWYRQGKTPEQMAALLAMALGDQIARDYLNTAILAVGSALLGRSEVYTDATGLSPDTLTFKNMETALKKFGDARNRIKLWITHSTPFSDLTQNKLANAANLFKFDTINVEYDYQGRPIMVTDSDALINTADTPDSYNVLGLAEGAVLIEDNAVFRENWETKNGFENIIKSYQAEWDFNLSLKGMSYDTENGGEAPTDAALGSSANWDKVATDKKDLPGVLLKVDFATS